ncbi:low molecular weight protein-tyrosine-phosphatase [Polycladidibacter hongkongensis]|uniref:low molecular weight protein-tyrosine-phosphatase n=1 Tax=Polycladidibacter hongkongensis TaxID=1647556 RepID=UPI0008376095|nr:low molecular weight protein-tyrosine-phosphatase [Pseudovibrio hongkongensis]
MKKHSVLFVCLGNICRSPLGEGIFAHLVHERGLEGQFEIDSAGTGAWHVGKQPDERSIEIAKKHGIDLTGQRARQVSEQDFYRFDTIIAMDRSNLKNLRKIEPKDGTATLQLMLPDGGDVPDPYYGGRDGFADVFTMVERACTSLLNKLAAQH